MTPLSLPPVSLEGVLKYTFLTVCIVLFCCYTYFQARNLIHGPSITLTGTFDSVQTERSVTLEGDVRNVVIVRLNGREIHTNERGHFVEALTLENGYTIMSLEAEDRYGRKTLITRGFVYEAGV